MILGTKKRPEIASPRKCETKHDDNATPKTCSKDTPKQQSNDQRNRQHDITDDGFGPGERYSGMLVSHSTKLISHTIKS